MTGSRSKSSKGLHSQLKKSAGFDSSGNPISIKTFLKRIKDAEAEVKSGGCMTIEQLEKESKKW